MKNITRHVGKLVIIQRLPSSTAGNPRYLIQVDGVTCATTSDSAYGYDVSNYEGKLVEATIGTHYKRASLNTLRPVPLPTEIDRQAKLEIISCIDGTGYDVVFVDNKAAISWLKSIFEKEAEHSIERMGYVRALEDYFRGLPSSCTIPFTNYDILNLAIKWGSLSSDATEVQEDKILNNYFNLMAVKTLQLFNGYRVPK